MTDLADIVGRIARDIDFSGVVSVDRAGVVEFAAAFGLANRAERVPNTLDTRFAVASGGKGLTALAVLALVEDGVLGLDMPARRFLGADLPLVGADVTVEHLLAHRSGIGDYVDEDAGHAITDHVLPVPVHELADTEAFVRVLDGHPAKFPAGSRFAYCNGGYVVLALIAERASGTPFHQLVRDRVCGPAGMADTDFYRSDEPRDRMAIGYLPIDGVSRTNVFHLPVRGNGDGGIYSTVGDVAAFWPALLAGRIVSPATVAEAIRPRSDAPADNARYGLGFWLHPTKDILRLEGFDAGVSFRGEHDPVRALTWTVISNSSDGAWPVARALAGHLA